MKIGADACWWCYVSVPIYSLRFTLLLFSNRGTQWHSWFRHCARNWKVAGFNSRWCPGSTGVDSAFNRNEYQEYFLEVKAVGTYGWQSYHLHVPIVLKSGSLNLLGRSGSVQTCTGIAFSFYYSLSLSCLLHFPPVIWLFSCHWVNSISHGSPCISYVLYFVRLLILNELNSLLGLALLVISN